jgi:hypothetical protein
MTGFHSELMINVVHGIVRRLQRVFEDFGYVRNDDDGESEIVEPELSEDIPLPFKPRASKSYRRSGKSEKSNDYSDSNILNIKDLSSSKRVKIEAK